MGFFIAILYLYLYPLTLVAHFYIVLISSLLLVIVLLFAYNKTKNVKQTWDTGSVYSFTFIQCPGSVSRYFGYLHYDPCSCYTRL